MSVWALYVAYAGLSQTKTGKLLSEEKVLPSVNGSQITMPEKELI